jgi:hypothetical protein
MRNDARARERGLKSAASSLEGWLCLKAVRNRGLLGERPKHQNREAVSGSFVAPGFQAVEDGAGGGATVSRSLVSLSPSSAGVYR